MRVISRRETVVCLLALAIGIGSVGRAQTPVAPQPPAETEPSPSKVFAYDQMPSRKSANGTESRGIQPFVLTTGETVGMHESMQPAGAAPVALHPIQHSEMILIQEGSLLFEHDGKQEKVGPGDLVYVAKGTVHRMTNVGTGPAKYFVVQIGGDIKK